MRIQCPSCSAKYEVADALLDPPRIVRCAQCSHDWMAAPIAEEALPEEPVAAQEEPAAAVVPVPEPVFGDTPLSAIERLSVPAELSPHHRRRDRLLTAAWAASFAALAAFGVAGYTQRDMLMRQWPASKRVYATLGLVPPDVKNQGAKDTATPPPR